VKFAADREMTLSDLVEEAIQDLLKKNGVDVKEQTKK
jgi:hypothetical protein